MRLKKNFKINFAEVENISTFAVPNETGEQKQAPRRKAEGIKN